MSSGSSSKENTSLLFFIKNNIFANNHNWSEHFNPVFDTNFCNASVKLQTVSFCPSDAVKLQVLIALSVTSISESAVLFQISSAFYLNGDGSTPDEDAQAWSPVVVVFIYFLSNFSGSTNVNAMFGDDLGNFITSEINSSVIPTRLLKNGLRSIKEILIFCKTCPFSRKNLTKSISYLSSPTWNSSTILRWYFKHDEVLLGIFQGLLWLVHPKHPNGCQVKTN